MSAIQIFLIVAFSSLALVFRCAQSTEPLVARQNYYQSQQYRNGGGNAAYNVDNDQQLALPIITAQQLSLKQLYGAGQSNVRLALNFAREPSRWNPYNPASEFRWRDVNPGAGIPADNAYIEIPNSGPYAKKQPYGAAYDRSDAGAALLSAPFQTWIPLNDSMDPNNIVTPANEGGLQWKSNVTIDSSQRFLVRLETKCRILGAENHPFPASFVSHADDDLRFGNCNFQFQPRDDNATSLIGVAITNKSVWALFYGVFGLAKRRIGIRKTYNDIVDIGLEYNAMTMQYTFYISGVPVWQVTDSLQAPPADGITKFDLSDPVPADATLPPRAMPVFGFAFGTHKCLDESDPWNQADNTRLVRTLGYDGVYPSNAVFYDNDNLRSNNLWGQTVKMTLYKVLVATASAAFPVVNAPATLPYYNSGGYVSQQQHQQPYDAAASTTYVDNNNNNNNYGNDNNDNEDDDDTASRNGNAYSNDDK